MEKHNWIGIEKIEVLVCKLSDENSEEYKLTCDRCLQFKSLKAKTEENVIWCSGCLPPHGKWVDAIIEERNNSDEEIEKVLKKIRESDSIIVEDTNKKF